MQHDRLGESSPTLFSQSPSEAETKVLAERQRFELERPWRREAEHGEGGKV